MTDSNNRILNRQSFIEQLKSQVKLANEHHLKLALIVVDINRFHRINSRYCYSTGDRILSLFADRLDETVREQDFVGRIGDNRFALLLNGIMNTGHTQLAVHKIERMMELPLTTPDVSLKLDLSMGIALCPMHASEPYALLKSAEDALTSARIKHKSYCFSDKNLSEDEISEYWDIELELAEAIEKEQLELYYQPKIDLTTMRPIGAEALLRWNSPSRGPISPELFMPIAETSGKLKQITNFTISTALRQSISWSDKWGPLSVSVNIPPSIFLQADFVDNVVSTREIWKETKAHLVLEMLESALVDDTGKIFQVLRELQEQDIEISIDDFGTGYSSLSYFKDIPANELKIDKAFIFELLESEAVRNIVYLIISLAKVFKLRVVAEGVENYKCLKMLQAMGCGIGQGYFISRPMPAEEFNQWLEQGFDLHNQKIS